MVVGERSTTIVEFIPESLFTKSYHDDDDDDDEKIMMIMMIVMMYSYLSGFSKC